MFCFFGFYFKAHLSELVSFVKSQNKKKKKSRKGRGCSTQGRGVTGWRNNQFSPVNGFFFFLHHHHLVCVCVCVLSAPRTTFRAAATRATRILFNTIVSCWTSTAFSCALAPIFGAKIPEPEKQQYWLAKCLLFTFGVILFFWSKEIFKKKLPIPEKQTRPKKKKNSKTNRKL